ncbi:MAG: DUF3472 domain-containing protein [Bacteroidota bacterium]|jgi:hypothetical protein
MKFYLFLIPILHFYSVNAQQHQDGNMYLHYKVAPSEYNSIEQDISPYKLANGTFWALTFGFNELSDGGYIGLQTDYHNTSKGLLIFSIWNATNAVKGCDGSYAVDFGGEGSGKSCRLSVPLVEQHIYTIKVSRLETERSGTYWGAWIIDKTINKEYYLGKIKTNTPSSLSNRFLNFVEYYGDKKPCDQVPYSEARFYSIKINCNNVSEQCKNIHLPFNYNYASCVKGSCNFYQNYTGVTFGGR